MEITIRHTLVIAALFFVIQGFITTPAANAQWETVFSGSNMGNSAQGYYIEGDTLILCRRNGGLWISEDGGTTWNSEPISPLDRGDASDFHFKFKGKYYLSLGYTGKDNFIRNIDSLTTWEYPPGFPQRSNGDGNRAVTFAVTDGEVIFIKTWNYLDEDSNEISDFLLSEDGEEWTRVSDGDYGNIIFFGSDLYGTAGAGIQLMMSENYGEDWNQVGAIEDSLQIRQLLPGSRTIFAEVWNRDQENRRKYAMRWNMDESTWESIFEYDSPMPFNVHVDGERVAIAAFDRGSYYSPDEGDSWLQIGTEDFNPQTVYLSGEYFYATGRGATFGEDLRRRPLTDFQEVTSAEPLTGIPQSLVLEPNYPNPFNPVTHITFHTDQPGQAELYIFDITGREVSVLLSDYKPAGTHKVVANLMAHPSGIYFYRLTLNGQSETRKMLLLK